MLQLQVIIWVGTPADISPSQKNDLVLVLQETIIAFVLTSHNWAKKIFGNSHFSSLHRSTRWWFIYSRGLVAAWEKMYQAILFPLSSQKKKEKIFGSAPLPRSNISIVCIFVQFLELIASYWEIMIIQCIFFQHEASIYLVL